MLQHENDYRKSISVVILCAGEGTRISNLSKDVPKPLIKIKELDDKPILQYSIENLRKLGIEEFSVIKGYLGYKIDEFLSSFDKKINIVDARDYYKKGPLHSLLTYKPTSNKNLLVLPGDTIFEFELIEHIFKLIEKQSKRKNSNPLIFYREIYANDLKSTSNNISASEIDQSTSIHTLKEIKQIEIHELNKSKSIFQVIPLFLLTPILIRELPFKGVKNPKIPLKVINISKTLREIINYLIKEGTVINAIKVVSEYDYYDIDQEIDLELLKEKKGQ